LGSAIEEASTVERMRSHALEPFAAERGRVMRLAVWLILPLGGVESVRNGFPVHHRAPAIFRLLAESGALCVKMFAGSRTRRNVVFIPLSGFRFGHLAGTLLGEIDFKKGRAVDFLSLLPGSLDLVSELVDAPNLALASLDLREPIFFALGFLTSRDANFVAAIGIETHGGGLGQAEEAIGLRFGWLSSRL